MYNSIGELVENIQEGLGYEYNSAGLIKRIYSLSNLNTVVSYAYNDKGLLYNKVTYTNSVFQVEVENLIYIYDAGGAQVATYKGGQQFSGYVYNLNNHTLYGAGRVGLLDQSTGKALFELSDHLGNVRAVVTASANGAAETVSYTDYFPHGGVLPGRTYQSSLNFPYGYQGQEKDAATGLTNFELRQYDPRIGRWYNPDPYGQHHSPYLAMSNNPVSFTDPDGGFDGDDGYNNAMPGIVDRNKNDFLAQSFGASGQPYNWMATSPADREMMQKFYGTNYNSSNANRFFDIASAGGYTAQDGSVYNLDGAGNLSRTVSSKRIEYGARDFFGIIAATIIDESSTELIGNISRYHEKWFDKSQEAQAYVYMSVLSEVSKKEVGAFITPDGLYIPPIDKNTLGSTPSMLPQNNHITFVKDEPYLYYNSASYRVIGAIHTHPKLWSGDPDQGLSDADIWYAKALKVPHFSMAWDGFVDSAYWPAGEKGYRYFKTGRATSFDLMNGKVSLISLLLKAK